MYAQTHLLAAFSVLHMTYRDTQTENSTNKTWQSKADLERVYQLFSALIKPGGGLE